MFFLVIAHILGVFEFKHGDLCVGHFVTFPKVVREFLVYLVI